MGEDGSHRGHLAHGRGQPAPRSPRWINRGFSLAIHRAGSTADAARPFAELDQSSLANGRAGPKTDSARPFAELDPRRIPIGCWPS
ncbi:hypothetical protein F2Q69_00036402 [Brassica cretica]|uniref:Uncharacterized protein n=1 Tax=Brassica cretica TaxID=69181 RepID=A0A8S9SU75_BRACR|nr:hypothetical protein F2Q69_00036402 [Brassica cretica]